MPDSIDELLQNVDRLAKVVALRRGALHDSLAPLGVKAQEVERDLYEYVASLKRNGVPPEKMVIAVKELLAERNVPLGLAAQAAFEQANHSQILAEAIITLAIGFYFGVVPAPD
jgi:hypothetical protein